MRGGAEAEKTRTGDKRRRKRKMKSKRRRGGRMEKAKKRENKIKPSFVKTYFCVAGILSILHIFVHLILTTAQNAG